jgi:predicted metal-dependent hydrolase
MSFTFVTKKSKGRRIRISINRFGDVFLHIPRFVPQFVAKRFLISKKEWVEKTLEKIKKHNLENPEPHYAKASRGKKEYIDNKEVARKLVHEKLEYWKNFYDKNFGITFLWKKVAIKNSKTRWGSCSSKKNLNFSYKIIHLSNEAQDYLIVHELSHLVHMNHSQQFWNVVALGIPEHKKLRKQLKEIKMGV